MKKILLFILVLFQVNIANSQSLVVTGDTVFYGDVNTQITHHLDIKNISNSSIDVVCQKNVVSYAQGLPSWAGAYYCFASSCYSASSTSPSDTAALFPGQSFAYDNSDPDAHSGYYNAGGVVGISLVEYCFYDANNPNDQTCVTITYDCSVTAIEDFNNSFELGDFYPNPANGIAYINFEGNSADLRIIDILGNEVKVIHFEGSGNKEIDLSEMSKGVYFGNLEVNNEIVSIKKLIVK